MTSRMNGVTSRGDAIASDIIGEGRKAKGLENHHRVKEEGKKEHLKLWWEILEGLGLPEMDKKEACQLIEVVQLDGGEVLPLANVDLERGTVELEGILKTYKITTFKEKYGLDPQIKFQLKK